MPHSSLRALMAPLRGQQDVGAEMALSAQVVVVAVHCGGVGPEAGQHRPDGLQHELHHGGAVARGVLLAPLHRLDVGVEGRLAFAQVGQIPVGQGNVVGLRLFLRQADVVAADAVADAAAAAVQHDPHPIGLVEAYLDEVVAAAEGAELLLLPAGFAGLHAVAFGEAAAHALVAGRQGVDGGPPRARGPHGARSPPARRPRWPPASGLKCPAGRRRPESAAAPTCRIRCRLPPPPAPRPPTHGTTDPTVAPAPRWASGMAATWEWMNGSEAVCISCSMAWPSIWSDHAHTGAFAVFLVALMGMAAIPMQRLRRHGS